MSFIKPPRALSAVFDRPMDMWSTQKRGPHVHRFPTLRLRAGRPSSPDSRAPYEGGARPNTGQTLIALQLHPPSSDRLPHLEGVTAGGRREVYINPAILVPPCGAERITEKGELDIGISSGRLMSLQYTIRVLPGCRSRLQAGTVLGCVQACIPPVAGSCSEARRQRRTRRTGRRSASRARRQGKSVHGVGLIRLSLLRLSQGGPHLVSPAR